MGMMNYADLIANSWRLTWQHKALWVLGALLAGGSILMRQALLFWNLFITPDLEILPQRLQMYAARISQLGTEQLTAVIIWATVVTLVVSLVVWLVITIAESAIIVCTPQLAAGSSVGWYAALRQGLRYLKQLIALDALIFLPWFVLSLIALLILLAMVLALAANASTITTAVRGIVAGTVCLLLLSCLLLPVSIITFIFRRLAFRDLILAQRPVRAAVRVTWQLIKGNAGTIIMLLLLSWGIQYTVSILLYLSESAVIGGLLLPLQFIELQSQLQTGLLWLFAVGLGLVTAVPQLLLATFTAVFWTLALQQLHNR